MMEVSSGLHFAATLAEPNKILIVDDEAANISILGGVLSNDYKLYTAKNGERAIELAKKHLPDLILMDVMMPGLSGYDVAVALKGMEATENIPIIFVTAMTGVEHEAHAFDVHAVDFIEKPIIPNIVLSRVRAHLSLVRADVLEKTYLEMVNALGRAAGYKDNETRRHITRMSLYCHILADGLGMSAVECKRIERAAPMHDVGKIGIRDDILLKPGPLTDDEWRVMVRHPEIGRTIIGEQPSILLRLAGSIAYTHHEKWDGSGYPQGLKGEDIPLEGRIAAIADVFDALTSERPYKSAWPIEQAVDYMLAQSGQHFDPKLIDVFMRCLPKVLKVHEKWT